ncbi:hypothetical protein COW98_04655 [Candidatus Roizmanbacteria bacterium CG22_combo_CG10-13_8_21_14_all_35_9]|uniref:Glycosyltransferase 2-like domain-containing protein n=3 Tax=Candidatus Roizmaniibacteriota TaxID=1752723 RepID=A0A2H0BZD5_9BACT|nr:MAG: hypothetical protein COX47_03240 [Candidatus Roizmanbacteria bacterium CG23_combo_of_CG06-09_8_20_14_all_35_49]PIP62318.1 MAG: hypothetical protein COW98_04655 [Candidatus Roizmanbacteria bacterium CG22_combo_CG10-13_8_21_14_all_35_9]PIY71358.1 MAG: hypothetical protein COY88_00775 [Candidatus Roizmanbacteria bacterium CG_4_10_14_0_8_um_filter_35_28]PJC82766.1 MAG: hypothetical protein CO006_01925 [Candidatus Roizmanbacteria bacterium CG_4_8_14_3_um_filter_35_14]
MKVSIIIPVYNEEKFIENCLDSLMKQTEKPDEIIVVDNNCTDRTINIVKKYPEIKIIREEEQGITHARNAGFNKAIGDIIARCDADSILSNNWIKTIKKIFSLNKSVVAITQPVIFYDIPLFGEMTTFMVALFYIYLLIPRLFIGAYPLVGPALAITKKAWTQVKNEVCLDDRLVHEDIDLSFHIKKYGKIYLNKDAIVKASGRRVKHNPWSFFGEYIFRFFKMLKNH